MLSIDEINLLNSQNERLKKQNKSLQMEKNRLKEQIKELKRVLKTERIRNAKILEEQWKSE